MIWGCRRNQTLPVITAFSSNVKINYDEKSTYVLKLIKWTNLIRSGLCLWTLYPSVVCTSNVFFFFCTIFTLPLKFRGFIYVLNRRTTVFDIRAKNWQGPDCLAPQLGGSGGMLPQKIVKFYSRRDVFSCILKLQTMTFNNPKKDNVFRQFNHDLNHKSISLTTYL